ncbi:hypothetical protein BpHYR1_048014 [Brachionus plicatilis]|uniref:Uncharacterized protein n=1 Tax=Brachionus plicatilis TaxID=10195 RepID=A0A3M7T9K8_BRAPC|nr:hypothetical protein BpHYR1_048014 [Brachionus plicatilis]
MLSIIIILLTERSSLGSVCINSAVREEKRQQTFIGDIIYKVFWVAKVGQIFRAILSAFIYTCLKLEKIFESKSHKIASKLKAKIKKENFKIKKKTKYIQSKFFLNCTIVFNFS